MSCNCAEKKQFVEVKVLDEMPIRKVMVRFVGTTCCNEQIKAYLNEMGTILTQEKQFIVLYDALHIGKVSMNIINKQAKFMRKFDTYSKKYTVACAIAVSSDWARKSLKVLFSLKKPVCPVKIFSDLDQCKEWLKQQTLK